MGLAWVALIALVSCFPARRAAHIVGVGFLVLAGMIALRPDVVEGVPM